MTTPPRRREPSGDDPFGDFFADFDKEFRRIQESMQSMVEDAMKRAQVPQGGSRPGDPFVYGFTMRLGPDGKPQFQSFGNTGAPHAAGPGSPEIAPEGGREPVTDLIEHDDHFSVTVELPGVEKEDVEVYATESQLTIRVSTPQRRYYKEVALAGKVKPETTEATFKNGVLDVSIQKAEPRERKDPGRRVNVK